MPLSSALWSIHPFETDMDERSFVTVIIAINTATTVDMVLDLLLDVTGDDREQHLTLLRIFLRKIQKVDWTVNTYSAVYTCLFISD
jgi:hypothetical protein